MKTRLLIIIGIVIIAAIIVSAVGTTQYQTAYNQNCNSDGGKVVGFLKCIYINEDFGEKLGSDCRMMFGKGTPEMFDCLEKIESEPVKVKALCESPEIELVDGICQKIINEPEPIVEGYEICLFENGKYKEVPESYLETHLAHGGEMVDCNTFPPQYEIEQQEHSIEIILLENSVEEQKNFVVYYPSKLDTTFHIVNQDNIPYKIDGTSDNEKNSFTMWLDANEDGFLGIQPNNYEGVKYIELSVSNPDTGEVYEWMNHTINFSDHLVLFYGEKVFPTTESLQ